MDITTGDYPIDCPTECTTEIPENLYVITDISKSGPTINDLGGYCTETQGVSKTGKEWWYDNNNCVVYVKSYTDSNDISCIGEYVSPVGVQVNSFDHKDGTLTPTSTNKLFDTGIRYIDSDNDPIVIVTEWNSVLNKLINVHILCDCSFDGSANEVEPQPTTTPTPTPTPTIVVNTETEINIFFDSSGSMNSTLSPLTTMRNSLLQNCLLPFYNNDVNLYNSRVTITNKNDERAINWISTQPSNPTYNVVNLAFADESNGAYEAESPTVSGWTNGSTAGNNDIALLRTNLDNATTPTSHRGIIFQVDTLNGSGNESYPQYQAFMDALFNGTGYYNGTAGLSDKSEVSCVQDTVAGSTPQYYLDLIVSAMNNLGYNITGC